MQFFGNATIFIIYKYMFVKQKWIKQFVIGERD